MNKTLLPLLLLTPLAQADLLSGHVVNAGGAPVPNVDIDAFDQVSGNELTLSGDFTDASGNFTIDIPVGLYTIVLNPPPGSGLLDLSIPDVTVVGNTNLGTLVLQDGALLSGRVLRAGGIPVVGLDLDVIDLTTGLDLDPSGDFTDNFGRFEVQIPLTLIELQFEPDPNGSPRLAPEAFELEIKGHLDLGDILLEPGFIVTATVRRSNGSAVTNADLDAIDLANGEKRFTPTDNSNDSGFVDVVVAAGTYTFDFCTPLTERLVTTLVTPIVVNANTALGVVTMPAGVVLSGITIAENGGAPVVNVDLDLFTTPGGAAVPLCHDNSDVSGNYAVIVPNGTYSGVFTPDYATRYASDYLTSVVVNGDTVLIGRMPDCDCTRAGQGTAGTGGLVPHLKLLGGSLRSGNPDLRLRVTQGRGGASAFLWAGLAGTASGGTIGGNLAIGSGMMLLPPTLITLSGSAGVAGTGAGGTALPFPEDPSLVGSTLRMRAAVLDPAADQGRAFTRWLMGTICD